MPSLQETVEQQAATIQQLSEIVAKSEARHRSLERMIRWMGIGVFVLAIVLVMPIKQDLFSVAHATTEGSSSQNTKEKEQQTTCGDMVQNFMDMPCKQLKGMIMKFAKMENLKNTPLGYSDDFLSLIGSRIKMQMTGDAQKLIGIIKAEKKELSNLTSDQKGQIKQHLSNAATLINSAQHAELSKGLEQLHKATKKLANAGSILDTVEQSLSREEQEALAAMAQQRIQLTYDLKEKYQITQLGSKMTLMDHVANIDYDFDNLTTIGRVIPQLIADMNNMSEKMNSMDAHMESMSKNMEKMNDMSDDINNMSNRMDTMARDMHNMNSMAFDIHNMAATGVPVMGRMNNATSWMPWW